MVADWRQLLFKNALITFTQFMEDREITSPTEMNRLMEELTVEQKRAGIKRKELMDQVLELKPPKVSPALVYEWREASDKLYEDLGRNSVSSREYIVRDELNFVLCPLPCADNVHSCCLLKLQQCLDSTHRQCEDEMERLRVS